MSLELQPGYNLAPLGDYRHKMGPTLLAAQQPSNPIDRAQRHLRTLGWSYGDMCHWRGTRPLWMVYARRDSDQIVVNADTQSEAWDEALRQAGIVQRS
jgi:hypothetical protein